MRQFKRFLRLNLLASTGCGIISKLQLQLCLIQHVFFAFIQVSPDMNQQCWNHQTTFIQLHEINRDCIPDMNPVFFCRCSNRLNRNTARGQLKLGILLLLSTRAGFESSFFELSCILANSDFSLEDGTVFDSSASRGAPFGKIQNNAGLSSLKLYFRTGPFVHGRGQIIQGYTEVLTGRYVAILTYQVFSLNQVFG